MPKISTASLIRWLFIALVVVVALGLRLRATALLPVDYDEDDYLRAAQLYAQGVQEGDWSVFTRENYRPEHPPLSKMLYGLAIAGIEVKRILPDRPTTAPQAPALPQPQQTLARLVGVVAGTLAVAVLAVLNPLGAWWLAVSSWDIKYTAQIMLEAVPTLTTALMFYAYTRWAKGGPGWLVLSAVMLGLTAAAKYPYVLAGVAVSVHWLWRDRARWRAWVLWGALAGLVFVLANPYLWPDPLARLSESLLYHGDYAQSEAVRRAGYPPWQPLVWLTMSVPWHEGVFLFMLDLPITVLAVLGVRRAWRTQPALVLWLGLVLAFLLVWNTKWPQYILMLLFPLCYLAGEGTHGLWERLWAWLKPRLSVRPT